MKKKSCRKRRIYSSVLFRARNTLGRLSFVAFAMFTSCFALAQTAPPQPIVVDPAQGETAEEALRAAVALANSIPGLNRIEFAPGLTEINLLGGQIEITEPLEIAGAPGQVVTINRDGATGSARIFAARALTSDRPDLRLEYLVLEGGQALNQGGGVSQCSLDTFGLDLGRGGAICAEAAVVLFDTVVRGNEAALGGGGIFAEDGVRLEFSVVTENAVLSSNPTRGGGIQVRLGEPATAVVCVHSEISDNQILEGDPRSLNFQGSGGGVFAGRFEGEDCLVTGNGAGNGGGIRATYVELSASTIVGNIAFAEGARGGGIFAPSGSIDGEVFCEDSRIADNEALDGQDNPVFSLGGGVDAYRFSAVNCVIAGNRSGRGAGISAAVVLLDDSTVVGNTATFFGGGISLDRRIPSKSNPISIGGLQLVNSTLSSNRVIDVSGAAIYWNLPDVLDQDVGGLIANSTITANEAELGVAGIVLVDTVSILDPGVDESFALELISTIVSGNFGAPQAESDLEINFSGVGVDERRSVSFLVEDRGNFISIDDSPELDELDDNGCFLPAGAFFDSESACVFTHRPRIGSPVIDVGINAIELSFDQRGLGFNRVIGAGPDVGAFETEPFSIEAFGLEVPSPIFRGEEIQIFWAAVPTVPAVGCVGSGLPGTTWPGAEKPASGFEIVDSTPLEPGQYIIQLECELDGELSDAAIPVEILSALDLTLSLDPSVVLVGGIATLEWAAQPDDSGTICTALSEPTLAEWQGSIENTGSLEIDTSALAAGVYLLELQCERGDFTASDSVELTVSDAELEVALQVSPQVANLGQLVQIDWAVLPADELSSCVGLGLPGTPWNGPQANSGSLVIDTSALGAGQYTIELACSRLDVEQSAFASLVVQDLNLVLNANPISLVRGDPLTLSWSGGEGLICTGTGLPGTTWPGGNKPGSGTETVSTAPLPAGDYTVGLLCGLSGVTLQAEATITVVDLELVLSATPSSLTQGELLTLNWSGTNGLVCTGSGLPGTTWPGAGKPGSGTESVSTAPLPAGDYTIGLQCERTGLTIEAEATITVTDLNLSLTASPTSLIRGDVLTLSWTGTEGLACAGAGLPGTTWPGTGKPASGAETVETGVLDRGEYLITLSCERLGAEVEASATVIILAEPAELALAAQLIDMGIAGNEFAEFKVSNVSENTAFEVQFRIDAPAGYEVASVFRLAPQCSVTPGPPGSVQCDLASIPEWTCETATSGSVCRLPSLPAGGVAGVVVRLVGTGAAAAMATTTAENADDRSAELSIGN